MNWHLLHIKPLTADYPQPSSNDKTSGLPVSLPMVPSSLT
jgi:hypothetical protein